MLQYSTVQYSTVRTVQYSTVQYSTVQLVRTGVNPIPRYTTQFAAAKAGLVLVNINPAYQTAELAYCLNKVMAVT